MYMMCYYSLGDINLEVCMKGGIVNIRISIAQIKRKWAQNPSEI